MKLKCIDGKVRNFTLPYQDNIWQQHEAQCLECGEYFGIHDAKILKPMFKKHICKNKK